MGCTEGKNESFLAIKMKIHNFFFFQDPLEERQEIIPDCYVHICGIFATVIVLRDTH